MNASGVPNKDSLFHEFTPPTFEEWRDLVIAELDGGDFAKKLVWKSREGIDVQPLYTAKDVEQLPHLDRAPGFAPFVRGTTALENVGAPWLVAQAVTTPDPGDAAADVRTALSAGGTSVAMRLDTAGRQGVCITKNGDGMPQGCNGVSVHTLDDSKLCLDPALESGAPIHVEAGCSAPVMLAHASILAGRAAAQQHGVVLTGAIMMDPIATIAETGSLPASIRDVFAVMASMIAFERRNDVHLRTIGVSAEPWHNAGASIIGETAFALATGAEYIRRLLDAGCGIDEIAKSIRFTFPIGTNFFFEIARLRAARMLWAKIVRAFGAEDPALQAMDLHVRTSWRQQTAYDPYVNMLRATVESLAGALGGARSMHTAHFDEALGAPSAFSSRIARNTQIVLQEESHLTKIVDPAGGSYYIEHLTDRIGREVWALFQRIESAGGMLEALRSGLIHSLVEDAAKAANDAVSQRREILIGTNQYPNLTERPHTAQQHDMAAVAARIDARLAAYRSRRDETEVRRTLAVVAQSSGVRGDGLIEAIMAASAAGATRDELLRALYPIESASDIEVRPFTMQRVAGRFERIRRAVESRDPRPRAFLATFGPAFWHRARAGFASGFLGAGGFAMIDNPGFDSAELAAEAAAASGAEIVVICSDDESYPLAAPVIAAEVKRRNPETVVLVAGNPKDHLEALKAAGVDDFMHVRSDCGAMLEALCVRLGVDTDTISAQTTEEVAR